MAGKTKWGHLKDVLPELPNPNAEYQAKLQNAVNALKGCAISDLTKQINDKKDELEALNARVTFVKFSIEAAEQALTQAMTLAGFPSVVSSGYTWTPTGEPYPQVKDRVALRAWADEHANESLSLNPQTLKSIVKAALEANEPLPPGVEAFWKPSISRTAKES